MARSKTPIAGRAGLIDSAVSRHLGGLRDYAISAAAYSDPEGQAELILEAIGYSGSMRWGDGKLGGQPKISLEEDVRTTYAWCRQREKMSRYRQS